jgi:hypothetical protein
MKGLSRQLVPEGISKLNGIIDEASVDCPSEYAPGMVPQSSDPTVLLRYRERLNIPDPAEAFRARRNNVWRRARRLPEEADRRNVVMSAEQPHDIVGAQVDPPVRRKRQRLTKKENPRLSGCAQAYPTSMVMTFLASGAHLGKLQAPPRCASGSDTLADGCGNATPA